MPSDHEHCADGLQDVCLVTALRSFGVSVPYTSNGPFRALADGNVFLEPFRMQLVHVSSPATMREGNYVRWSNDHFMGVSLTSDADVEGGGEWFRSRPLYDTKAHGDNDFDRIGGSNGGVEQLPSYSRVG